MTNYANWHAYYRTRMQLMKTAASRAFAGIDTAADIAAGTSRFRVGLMTINNNTGSDFVNLDEFKTAHKNDWYNKLFAASPNDGTPLRTALSKAGRLYAGQLDSTLNGVSVTDPLQYSCQQNFTILSTDGFWNSGAGYKLDGSTLVGDQDGGWPAPYNDGGTAVTQQRTSRLQSSTETQRAEKGTLQSRTSQLQTQAPANCRAQTSTLQSARAQIRRHLDGLGAMLPVAPAQWDTYPNASADTHPGLPGRMWPTCDAVAQDTERNNGVWERRGNASTPLDWHGLAPRSCNAVPGIPPTRVASPWPRECQTVSSAYADAASCAVTTPDASGNFTECRYNLAAAAATQTCAPAYVANNYTNPTVYRNCGTSNSTWTNATTCTEETNYSASGTRTTCRYTGWSAWGTVSTCTPVAQSTGPNYTVGTAVECQRRRKRQLCQ